MRTHVERKVRGMLSCTDLFRLAQKRKELKTDKQWGTHRFDVVVERSQEVASVHHQLLCRLDVHLHRVARLQTHTYTHNDVEQVQWRKKAEFQSVNTNQSEWKRKVVGLGGLGWCVGGTERNVIAVRQEWAPLSSIHHHPLIKVFPEQGGGHWGDDEDALWKLCTWKNTYCKWACAPCTRTCTVGKLKAQVQHFCGLHSYHHHQKQGQSMIRRQKNDALLFGKALS